MKNVSWVLRDLGFLENLFVNGPNSGCWNSTTVQYCQSPDETLN